MAALLTLPARWGGKGLPLPEANAEIVLTAPGTYAVPGTRTPPMPNAAHVIGRDYAVGGDFDTFDRLGVATKSDRRSIGY